MASQENPNEENQKTYPDYRIGKKMAQTRHGKAK
jgi:hypothetical protein